MLIVTNCWNSAIKKHTRVSFGLSVIVCPIISIFGAEEEDDDATEHPHDIGPSQEDFSSFSPVLTS